MKILVFILSIVATTILEIAAILLVVLVRPHPAGQLFLIPTTAITFFFYGALSLGSAAFYWDFGASDGSRRYMRRYLWILIGVEVLGAIGLAIYTVITGAPAWLPVVLIVLAAVLTVVAPVIGRALRRYDDKHGKPAPAWRPVEATVIRRKVRAIIITFAVALIVTFVGLTLLLSAVPKFGLGNAVVFAIEFASFAAAFAGIIATLPFARAMRTAGGRDIALTRKIAKVVLRDKPIELTDTEKVAAANYAGAAATYFPFFLAFISLLYLGIGLQQLYQLLENHAFDPLVNAATLILLAVVFVVFFPITVVRARRARRYAMEHADLATAPATVT